ncbi:MAG: hypothetical protein JRH11_05040 [Deltaproteobacteria bacterium]|nr:hypothetical protein [Deltaproteobacteria bacterium]
MREPSNPAVAILALAGLAAFAAACEEEVEERPPPPVIVEAQPPGPAANPNALYDEEGNLLESDVVVAGLRLPRGFELTVEVDRRHVYDSHVPIEKIHRYFGPRLITGQVDRHGDGATFREAVPRAARGGIVKLDVSIVPRSRTTTRIEIRELLPAPANPLSEDEIIRRWAAEEPRLD